MPNLDLKIIFGVDLRESDFERVSRELNRIQDATKRLDAAMSQAGSQGSVGLAKAMESMTSLGRIGDAIKNVQGLTQAIESLTRTQGGLTGLMRHFSELGRTINEAVGDKQLALFRQHNLSVDSLRQAATIRMGAIPQAEAMAARAEAMGNPEAAMRYRSFARQAPLLAGQALDVANYQQFVRPLGQIVTGVGAGIATAAFVGGAAESAVRMLEFAPVRGQIAVQDARLSAARAAAAGLVTPYVTNTLGLGLEAGGPGMLDRLRASAGYLVGGWNSILDPLTQIPILGRLVSMLQVGSDRYATLDERYTRLALERRGFDVAKYGPLFDEAGKLIHHRIHSFDRVLRGVGARGLRFDEFQRTMLEANEIGIPDELLEPAAEITARLGLDFRRTSRMAGAGRRLGLTAGGLEQMLRYSARSADAEQTMQDIVMRSGVLGLGGREALSEAVADVMARGTGNYNPTSMTQMMTTVTAGLVGARGNIPEPEMVQTAVGVTNRLSQMAGGGLNVMNMSLDMAMIELGLNNPVVRMRAAQMWQTDPDQAVRGIAAATGRSVDEVRARMRRAGQGAIGAIGLAAGSGDPQSLAFMRATGHDVLATGLAGRPVTGAPGDPLSTLRSTMESIGLAPTGPAAGPSADLTSPLDAAMRESAKNQAVIIRGIEQTMGNLGKDILNAILTGMRDIGVNIQRLAENTSAELPSAGQRSADQVTVTPKNREKISRRYGGRSLEF
jgi:hypothetical protein